MMSAGFAGRDAEKSCVSNALCASRHEMDRELGSIAVSLRVTTNKGAKTMSHTARNMPVSLKLPFGTISMRFAALPA